MSEPSFLETCTRGGDCIAACPQNVIVKGGGGFPEISFASDACTFCGDCVDACPGGALKRAEGAPWSAVARVADHCLSLRGVTCRTCGDRCDADAITFKLQVGGIARPTVDPDLCTGCGACVAPCPVDAVEVRPGDTPQ